MGKLVCNSLDSDQKAAGIKYSLNVSSAEALYNYLVGVADLFVPNLLERVDNLREYAGRIKEKAVIIEAWDKDYLAGMLAVYLNDFESKVGFISIISVTKECQRKGIAKALLSNAVKMGRENNFEKIRLEASKKDKRSIAFYKANQFVISGENPRSNSFIMELSI